MIRRLVTLLLCLLLGHDVGFIDVRHLCRRCGRDTRPDWMIQMEAEDRLEALVMRVKYPPPGPKDWSPRTGRCACTVKR